MFLNFDIGTFSKGYQKQKIKNVIFVIYSFNWITIEKLNNEANLYGLIFKILKDMY